MIFLIFSCELGVDRICKDAEFMIGRNPGVYWRTCWGILTPAVMITVLLYTLIQYEPLTYGEYVYPTTAYGESFFFQYNNRELHTIFTCDKMNFVVFIFLFISIFNSIQAIGWTISMIGVIQLPLWAVYAVIKQKGDTWSEKIANSFQPNAKWGPIDPIKNEKYQKYITNWQNELTANPPTTIFQKIMRKIYY